MIQRNKFQINYIKKEKQTGSYLGMRFTLLKEDDKLTVIIYPEPCCLEATPESLRQSAQFELTSQGLDAAIDWLNEQYTARKPYWEDAYENRMKL
mgnify:CR=1 FL=1